MFPAIITAGLGLLAQAAPLFTSSTAVGSAINFISTVLVPGAKLVKEEVEIIKSVITTLRGNKSVTVDQMAELDALDARCDKILDAAIEAAEAEDAKALGEPK